MDMQDVHTLKAPCIGLCRAKGRLTLAVLWVREAAKSDGTQTPSEKCGKRLNGLLWTIAGHRFIVFQHKSPSAVKSQGPTL